MSPETLSMLLQYVISPAVAGIVLWLIFLTKKTNEMDNKLGINTALDKQTQSTLTEIKLDMKEMGEHISKIMAKLDIH